MKDLPQYRNGNCFTLAYSRVGRTDDDGRPVQGFLITHCIKGREELFSLAACDTAWNILELRGRLPSAEHAVLFGSESWGLRVEDWILYSAKTGEKLFSKPRTNQESRHAKARKQMARLLEEFKYFGVRWERLMEEKSLRARAVLDDLRMRRDRRLNKEV